MSGLNTDNDGVVDYDMFLKCLRGQLNDARLAKVKACWCKFGNPGMDEKVSCSDLRVAFDSSQHPKVISGEITADEAFLEFLTNFGDKHNDGKISMMEWGDYYSAVSACIQDDGHFAMLIDQQWGC